MDIPEIEDKIKIVDNFLPEAQFKALQSFMMGDKMQWHRNEGVSNAGDGRQFIHPFLRDAVNVNWSFPYLNDLVTKINPLCFIRVKANLLPPTQEIIKFDYHIDVLELCLTSIFYINTNNGYTFFKNGEVIESVENRFVTFPSCMLHAGTTSSDGTDRVVINLNYYPRRVLQENKNV